MLETLTQFLVRKKALFGVKALSTPTGLRLEKLNIIINEISSSHIVTLGLDFKFPSYGTNPQIPVENLSQDWELCEPHGDNHKTIRAGERPFCVCK